MEVNAAKRLEHSRKRTGTKKADWEQTKNVEEGAPKRYGERRILFMLENETLQHVCTVLPLFFFSFSVLTSTKSQLYDFRDPFDRYVVLSEIKLQSATEIYAIIDP